MKNILNFGYKFASVLISLSFLLAGVKSFYFSALPIPQLFHASLSNGLLLFCITALFLLLNVMACYGLFFARRWGFIIAYIAILFSSIFFGLTYLPGYHLLIANHLSIEGQFIAPILINLIVIAYIAYLHTKTFGGKVGKLALQLLLILLNCFLTFGYLASYEYHYPCINHYHFIYLLIFFTSSCLLLKLKSGKLNSLIVSAIILLLTLIMAIMAIMALNHNLSAGLCFKF